VRECEVDEGAVFHGHDVMIRNCRVDELITWPPALPSQRAVRYCTHTVNVKLVTLCVNVQASLQTQNGH
jgi:hypothetical protein